MSMEHMAKSLREILNTRPDDVRRERLTPEEQNAEIERERGEFFSYLREKHPEIPEQFLPIFRDVFMGLPADIHDELLRRRKEMAGMRERGYAAAAEDLERKIWKILRDRTHIPGLIKANEN